MQQGCHLLFVTGIPSKTEGNRVAELFKPLGNFRLVCLKTRKHSGAIVLGNPNINLKRGFCILQALDRESYARVLACGSLHFEGRSIKVSEFKRDTDLEDAFIDEESTRVVVKRVPSTLNQDSVSQIISQRFGPLKRIFEFTVESHFGQQLPKRYHSFSVEFQTPESAKAAVKLAFLHIRGLDLPIIIEGFKRKKSATMKRISIHLPGAKIAVDDFDYTHQCGSHENCSEKYRFAGELDTGIDHSSPEFDNSPEKQSVKPTRSEYYILRERTDRVSPLSTERNLRVPENKGLRFNKAMKPIRLVHSRV